MAGQVTTNLSTQDWKDSAKQWKKELLLAAVIGYDDTLKHMTPMAGIKEKLMLGQYGMNSQLRPYTSGMSATNNNLEINWRELETYQGALVEAFEPNSAIQTIIGKAAAGRGEGLKNTEAAKYALAAIANSVSGYLNMAIWKATRVANGTTTMQLFNGFDTITATEITAGNISAAKGNYLKLSTKMTSSNAMDLIKQAVRSLSPELRSKPCNLYCSQEVYDMYCDDYQSSHGALPYNTEFAKGKVEDSLGNITFVPLASKANSSYIHICPKENLVYGYDNMSDAASVGVEKYSSFELTFEMSMFFGVQFASLDKRIMKVIELADVTVSLANKSGQTSSYGTVKINSGTAGTSASANVPYGQLTTLTATPGTGYKFKTWSDGDTNATRTVEPTDNLTLTAEFEAEA